MRYLAIDLGDRRTGLAAGDDATGVAAPLGVITLDAAGPDDGVSLLDAIARAVEEHLGTGPGELVVGLPLNMDGSDGPRARATRAFADRLAARTGRRVHLQDERLTTSAADWAMERSGLTRGRKKQRRDALAAAALLRDFLAGRAG